uniref:Polypeptide N-acetylgalactosaminyltransferase n=2 Tax=Stomoxys calcitrans TaxID=35570 RepID=A0A1I8P8R1_STOCA
MVRSKHSYSLLRYQFNNKVTYQLLLLLLSLCGLSIGLIILYGHGIISQKNVAVLKFFKRQISENSLKEHIAVSTNRQLRDWHKGPEGVDEIGQRATTNNLQPEFIGGNSEHGLRLTGFNVNISRGLPLQRSLPDTRHKKCQRMRYPSLLPKCSIIVVYRNEQASVLLRTLHSLLDRTPEKLLEEIILVDDYSDPQDDDEGLQIYMKNNFGDKIQMVHLKQREGLIRARLEGARRAKAEVLVFLDAHIEVNVNWLPPLLAPIVKDSTTSTTPIIDIIKYDTFEYQGAMPSRGGFNWQFNYVQLPLLKEEERLIPRPHNNPVMNGGLFAITKKFFWHLGAYDEGLEIWGAEQYELSFKIWLCGGKLLEVPCSRIGHLYRSPEFAVSYTKRKDDFISKNYKRVAEVWMDEYKDFLYEHIPKLNQIEAGDLTKQKLLRQRLQCKPFKWFMEHIAFDLLKIYPPIKPPDFASGAIKSLALPDYCLDVDNKKTRLKLEDVLRPCSPDLKYPYDSQKWYLGFRRDLQHHGNCLEVQAWGSHAPIWLWPCHNSGGNQWWYYDRTTQMLIQGEKEYTQRCLEVDSKTREIFVNYCDLTRIQQKWKFGYINETAMDNFFMELK